MRTITREIFLDEFFGLLPMEFRLLWIGLLINAADDQGRMADNPALIKAQVFPYDEHVTTEIIEHGLRVFAAKQKILRYIAGNNGSGKHLIQIVNWWKYQKSARWAARSLFPAPAKWVDRVRTHERGSGQTPVEMNWDKPGGFTFSTADKLSDYIAAVQPQHNRNTKTVKRQHSREDEDEDEYRGRGRGKPTPPTPRPSKPAGGLAQGKEQAPDPFKELKPKQHRAAERVSRILDAASLRNAKKKNSLSILVTTRNSTRDPIALTMGALASAYADPNAENKAAVAAYRMQHDQVEPGYLDPKTWTKLPTNILSAAGIDDIAAYITKRQIENMTA